MSLDGILSRLNLTDEETGHLVNLLMASVAGLVLCPEMDPKSTKMLREISDALSRIRPHPDNLGENGYLWRGKFPELSPGLLDQLRQDAAIQRSRAVHATRHPLVEKPPLAQAVGASVPFAGFVKGLVSTRTRVEWTSSFYHYYEATTDCVEPHLDTEEFALSCLLLVQHRYDVSPASRFYICPPGRGPIEVTLAEGDAIVFYSGSIVHARSAPHTNESVITASWGFGIGNGRLDT